MFKMPCGYCGQRADHRYRYCGAVCQILAHCTGVGDPARCWVWSAAIKANGYGAVRVKINGRWGVRTPARAMYAAHYGEVPYTQSVLNTCDTKNCCNPKHLQLGVQQLPLVMEVAA